MSNIKQGVSHSFKWFSFYKFFLIPVNIILYLLHGLFVINFLTNSFFSFKSAIVTDINYIFLSLVLIDGILIFSLLIISIFIFIGFIKKKLWAWRLNFIFLIIGVIGDSIAMNVFREDNVFKIITFGIFYKLGLTASLNFDVLSIVSTFLTIIIFGLIWLLPNWVYFRKRKEYFKI